MPNQRVAAAGRKRTVGKRAIADAASRLVVARQGSSDGGAFARPLPMSLYQIIFSTLRMLAIATGLFALGRTILLGSGGGAWALMSLMSFLAIGASIIINRLPLHEKYLRFKDAPRWQELSPQRRFALFLFDLPLFFSIRDKEADRLRDEPISRVEFEANCVTLQPVEARHLTWHFLTTIAWHTEHYGLKVSNANFGKFGLIFPGSKRVPEHRDNLIRGRGRTNRRGRNIDPVRHRQRIHEVAVRIDEAGQHDLAGQIL